MKKKKMILKSLRMPEDLIEKVKKYSERNNRSFTNSVNTLLMKYFEAGINKHTY